MEIWKIIVQSNTFNFILMVLIFAWIIKASKLSQKLDDAVLKVKETIDNSTLAKEKSSEELKNANE
ncbi:hypothetical protein IJ531_03140 [bacterium]|nr:hypothetical protein [bacterium]